MLPTLNRSAVTVKPKQPFVDWLRSADPTSGDIAAEAIAEPTIYLLPASEDDEELAVYVRLASQSIFEDQLDAWYQVRSKWPADRGFEAFCRWFEFRADTLLLDLCDDALRHD